MRHGASAVATLITLGAWNAAAVPSAHAETMVVATGPAASVGYQLGRALCRLVNRREAGFACRTHTTVAAMATLADVGAGAVEFGVVPSDVQFHAAKGTGPFAFVDIPYGNVRAVLSVHAEPFTLMARRDARIAGLTDLRGRRVNIGNPGSRQRATMDLVMRELGWTKSTFSLAEELPADQQSLALCHGRVEAIVYTVGHPNDSIGKVSGLCDAVLVDVSGTAVDALIRKYPYFGHAVIAGGTYGGTPADTRTFGVRATLITSSDVPAATVQALVGAVFEDLERLRRMHPAFATLDAGEMTREGLTAPLHEGAAAYYRARGLK